MIAEVNSVKFYPDCKTWRSAFEIILPYGNLGHILDCYRFLRKLYTRCLTATNLIHPKIPRLLMLHSEIILVEASFGFRSIARLDFLCPTLNESNSPYPLHFYNRLFDWSGMWWDTLYSSHRTAPVKTSRPSIFLLAAGI